MLLRLQIMIEDAIHTARLNYDNHSGLDWSMANAVVKAIEGAGYRLHRDHDYQEKYEHPIRYESCSRCGQRRPGLADNSSCDVTIS